MHLYKIKRNGYVTYAIFLGVFLCAVLLLWMGSRRLGQTAEREQTELLTEALNQAVVSCYAVEGRYPESLGYLIENYGIQVDQEKYVVVYDIFADNIRPQVQVIRIGE